jgi:hypothetical protein
MQGPVVVALQLQHFWSQASTKKAKHLFSFAREKDSLTGHKMQTSSWVGLQSKGVLVVHVARILQDSRGAIMRGMMLPTLRAVIEYRELPQTCSNLPDILFEGVAYSAG